MIQTIVEQYDGLQGRLKQLSLTLKQRTPAHWIAQNDWEKEHGISMLDTACDILTDVWYRDGQDGRETRSRHGFILADTLLQQQVVAINGSKDALRHAINDYQRQNPNADDDIRQLLGQRHSEFRAQLTVSGLARLHLKQCYRHIPLLDNKPEKIGFSWYVNGRSIKQISVAEIREKLMSFGSEKAHITIQLGLLNDYRAHDIMAQVQTLAPIVRANLVFIQANQKTKKAMNVSLPLFIASSDSVMPPFNEITAEPPIGRSRQARNDQRLEEKPFIPSLRIYRYRQRTN